TLKCWASLFSGPAMHYRNTRSIQHNEASMAVAVQKMVNSKAAGVMFTLDPVSGDRSKIVLEGAWGLGEGVVGGHITPDHYGVIRGTFEVVEEWISPKYSEFVRDPQTGLTVEQPVEEARRNISCLSREELTQLAKIALSIEQHYGVPQDIEWALDKDLPFPENLVILQSRPITVWFGQQSQAAAQ
ncbi:MAG: PEP/pyruvate-binding domain-containing protein, partial [Carboxydocellales bacterium]